MLIWCVAIVLALLVLTGWRWTAQLARDSASAPSAVRVTYVVSPHPDDEFQGWSLVEQRPDDYTVFIVLTHGEESGFCTPAGVARGYQPGLEAPPRPLPTGRWTQSCEDARLHSWADFFRGMTASDHSIPGDLTDPIHTAPFPAAGTTICRVDRPASCRSDRSALVWLDRSGRGALVAFDLGDGDLTPEEVAWAVETVRDHRSDLGINATLPSGGVVGASFANRDDDCFRYPHPDHVAVHQALHDHDFQVAWQAAATCADDPEAVWSRTVSRHAQNAAFALGPEGRRRGSHNWNYGWLHRQSYPLDRRAQRSLFHTHQEFWVRFVH